MVFWRSLLKLTERRMTSSLHRGYRAPLFLSLLCFFFLLPGVLQAMAADGIFPSLRFFATTNGQSREPVRAIALTWCLTQLVILIGDLDLLLPVVTGCFLICFCAVNLTCFALEFFPARKVEVSKMFLNFFIFHFLLFLLFTGV